MTAKHEIKDRGTFSNATNPLNPVVHYISCSCGWRDVGGTAEIAERRHSRHTKYRN